MKQDILEYMDRVTREKVRVLDKIEALNEIIELTISNASVDASLMRVTYHCKARSSAMVNFEQYLRNNDAINGGSIISNSRSIGLQGQEIHKVEDVFMKYSSKGLEIHLEVFSEDKEEKHRKKETLRYKLSNKYDAIRKYLTRHR